MTKSDFWAFAVWADAFLIINFLAGLCCSVVRRRKCGAQTGVKRDTTGE